MTLKNMWSLNPGEVLAAQKLLDEVKLCEVYFPLKDTGTDLLVVRGQRHCRIQVKESRLYGGKESQRQGRSHSWHQVSKNNIQGGAETPPVDFFVFLTYVPKMGVKKISSFDYLNIVVPFKELEDRLRSKKPNKKGTYYFYFEFDRVDQGSVLETRDKPQQEYGRYLEKWCLICSALSGQ